MIILFNLVVCGDGGLLLYIVILNALDDSLSLEYTLIEYASSYPGLCCEVCVYACPQFHTTCRLSVLDTPLLQLLRHQQVMSIWDMTVPKMLIGKLPIHRQVKYVHNF